MITTTSHFLYNAYSRTVALSLILLFSLPSAHAIELLYPDDYVIEGYDVVSYFSESGPEKGVEKHAMRYAKQVFAFANEANALEFQKNPKKYLPQYNGNCAYGMVYGTESSIDPLVYEIVNNRLFFLINHGTHKRWKKRAPHYIKRGDKAWKKLVKKKTASN